MHEKLRWDLEIRSELSSEVIVKDPITYRFCRFTPVQALIHELLDGQRNLASVAQMASQKIGIRQLFHQFPRAVNSPGVNEGIG